MKPLWFALVLILFALPVSAGICIPGQAIGCKVCNSDGMAWADDSSKCQAGYYCLDGICILDESAPVVYAGWRSSEYGYQQEQGPAYWVNVSNQMVSKFSGSRPGGIWILGYEDNGNCALSFPSPMAYGYTNIAFSLVDMNENYLSAFDAAGMKVWLEVEPGDASVDTLIDLVLTRYKDHTSVRGFGVDVEWLNSANYADGRSVTDAEAQRWLAKVKSYNPNYKLFLKHWETGKMPPSYRDKDLVFISDSSEFSSMSGLITDFKAWGSYFSSSDVEFQFGYPYDRAWWSKYSDPAKLIGSAILGNVSNTHGLYWVDFTITEVFPPNLPPGCTNDCSASGAKRCYGTSGYQTCGNYDSDSCLEWSSVTSCSAGQTCSSGNCGTACTPKTCSSLGYNCGSASDGCSGTLSCGTCGTGYACTANKCVATCTNECSTSGSKQCSGTTGYKMCGNYDSDSCLEWSAITNCAGGQTCSNGACITTCTNECSSSGAKQCSGSGYQTCGNYDSDSCLEWSTVTGCSAGQVCSSGNCISSCTPKTCSSLGYNCGSASDSCGGALSCGTCPTGQSCSSNHCVASCTNECSSSGSKQCSGTTGYQTCGNYDSDSCLEWSSITNCASGQVCSGGACSIPCTNECPASGQTRCSGTTSYQTCGNYDSDSCLEWNVKKCPGKRTCQNGACAK